MEIDVALGDSVNAEMFRTEYAQVFEGDERWRSLRDSRERPVQMGGGFLVRQSAAVHGRRNADSGPATSDITGARVLAVLGDSLTTDHISPAGSIAADSSGREISDRARRAAARFQLLRRAARQSRGDGARDLRQYPAQESARAGSRRRLHASICRTARRPRFSMPASATARKACR